MISSKDILSALFAAAKLHGEISDPDHEVGDLQDALSIILPMLTSEQLCVVVSKLKESQDGFEEQLGAFHEAQIVFAFEDKVVLEALARAFPCNMSYLAVNQKEQVVLGRYHSGQYNVLSYASRNPSELSSYYVEGTKSYSLLRAKESFPDFAFPNGASMC